MTTRHYSKLWTASRQSWREPLPQTFQPLWSPPLFPSLSHWLLPYMLTRQLPPSSHFTPHSLFLLSPSILCASHPPLFSQSYFLPFSSLSLNTSLTVTSMKTRGRLRVRCKCLRFWETLKTARYVIQCTPQYTHSWTGHLVWRLYVHIWAQLLSNMTVYIYILSQNELFSTTDMHP